MRRMRHLPVDSSSSQTIPDVAASTDTVRREVDSALRTANSHRWAAPVGGMLALALGIAAVAHLVTG